MARPLHLCLESISKQGFYLVVSDLAKIASTSSPAFSLYERNSVRPELEQVAEEFEALFVSQMMKQIQQGKLAEGLFDSSTQDTYQGLLDQELSRTLATNADFGIANALKTQLADKVRKVEGN